MTGDKGLSRLDQLQPSQCDWRSEGRCETSGVPALTPCRGRESFPSSHLDLLAGLIVKMI